MIKSEQMIKWVTLFSKLKEYYEEVVVDHYNFID